MKRDMLETAVSESKSISKSVRIPVPGVSLQFFNALEQETGPTRWIVCVFADLLSASLSLMSLFFGEQKVLN